MAVRKILFVLLQVLSFSPIVLGGMNTKKHVVCYLASWANYRTRGDGQGRYVIEQIDPTLCTHAVYAFAKLENNKITVFDPYLDLEENYGLGGYKRFNNLKEKNPKLKTLIAIGGWNEGSSKYSKMASSAAGRATFARSVVEFLDTYGFDGLDLDWEYPANRGGKPEDKRNYVLLLQELHKALKSKGHLLTAAVSAGKSTIDSAYDILEISKYLDYINIMTYDFHGAWEKETGMNTPLYADEKASEEYKHFTVDYAVQYWIDGGAPKDKIILGFAFYGRSFTLRNASGSTGVGVPTIGNGGSAGKYTNQVGTLGFNEICLHLTRDGWNEKWNDTGKVPYAYKNDQWVSYDNQRSIEIKVDYLKQKGLLGGSVWSLDTDDFQGACYGQKNYLLLALTSRLWK